jgi:predicted AAA+ superfamily ATPase
LEKDLPMLGLEGSSEIMFKFWTFLASSQGTVWNASNFAKSLGVSPPTVNKYLLYLQSSYMIFKLYPYFINIRKRLVKSPKVYVRDSGILHNLCNIKSYDSLQRNPLLGFSFEGYVIEQIRQLKNDRIQLYFYRTQDGTEVDLVFVKSVKPIALAEIKYSSSPEVTKSLNISIQDLKTEKNFIITPYSDEYPVRKNITVCNLNDFLKKHLPKLK